MYAPVVNMTLKVRYYDYEKAKEDRRQPWIKVSEEGKLPNH